MLQSQIDYMKQQIEYLKEQIRELREAVEKCKPAGPELPWDEAPTWARWAAMDRDFGWWWYEDEPVMRIATWGTEPVGQNCESFAAPICPDWRKSKQARP